MSVKGVKAIFIKLKMKENYKGVDFCLVIEAAFAVYC